MLQFLLANQHIKELGTGLGDLGGQDPSGFQILELRGCVEVEHRGGVIVVDVARALHRLVHHLGDLEHFFDGEARRLIEFLRVELDARFRSEQLADLANEEHAVFFFLDVVVYVDLGVVARREPVEQLGHQLEVGLAEVLHRNVAVVAETPHQLAEVSQFSE